jgi:hypothetical protein
MYLHRCMTRNPIVSYMNLGNRDEGLDLNADGFRFAIDPYNKRQSGYVFVLNSFRSVQTEYLDDDITFDAVWQSAVKITTTGWTAEMKIPYSAIRFPSAQTVRHGVCNLPGRSVATANTTSGH